MIYGSRVTVTSGLRVALLAAVLALSGLVFVGPSAEAASASVSLSRSTAIAREKVTVTVKAGQRLKRPVRLQYRDGKRWRTWRSGTTNSKGVVRFSVSTARTSIVVRAYFPRKKIKKVTRPARASARRTLRTVRQSAVLEVIKTASGRTASAVATVSPARRGRKVSLQRREANGTWRTIVPGRATDARGRVSFGGAASDLDEEQNAYRVQVSPWSGAPAIRSPQASVVWAQTSLSLSRSAAIVGETVDVTLSAGHPVARPYVLEYLTGSTWTKAREGTTASDGTATTTIVAWLPETVARVRFPRAAIAGAVRPERTTRTVTVRQQEQSAALDVTMDSTDRTITATATLLPVREGREVTLQSREPGESWTDVDSAVVNSEGIASFEDVATEQESDGREYRALGAAWSGAPAIGSSSVEVSWTISVEVSAPEVGLDGAPTVLRATTSGPVDVVRFFVDGQQVGQDDAAPWEVTWAPVRGRHDVSARAISSGDSVLSAAREFDQPGIASDEATKLPAGFSIDTLQAGFDLPTAFEATESGRVFVAEKSGRVLTFLRSADGATSEPEVVADLSDRVSQEGDQGMTGLAIDPGFDDDSGLNQKIYVSYVVQDAGERNVWRGQQVQVLDLSRWTSGSAPLEFDDGAVILGRAAGAACVTSNGPYPEDCVPIIGNSHTINDLVFDHDGNLMVGIGDGAMFYAGLGGRSQSLRAQDPTILAGKVLRIDPETGRGVPGNPYYGNPEFDGATQSAHGASNASRVVALGLRNPFRLAIREDGLVMIGDVGEGAWEELNALPHDHSPTRPANYGWPCYEGRDRTDVPVSTGEPDPASNPWDVCKRLWQDPDAGVVQPVHTYPHAGGASITGGVFYTGDVYPADFQDSYFFGDYAQDFVRTARVDDGGDVSDVAMFAPAGVAGGPVKFAQGPDGRIWYASIYDGSIRVIDYVPPAAQSSCPVGTFARTYHDLTDSSLANDPSSYPEGWSWARLADATFPSATVGARDCVDEVRLDATSSRPDSALPSDRWGIRWQGRLRLDGGTYQFALSGKDWVRLWVDDQLVGSWFGYGGWGPVGTNVPVRLSAGIHTVRAELIHDSGEASAELTTSLTAALPRVSVAGPANGEILPAPSVDGVRSATMPFRIGVSAEDGAPDLTRAVVTADLVHVTGPDQHVHPSSTEYFDLNGDESRSAELTGSFTVKDSHAPGSSVFRLRARVEDASGAVRWSAPVYVCLEGNAVGICATS